MSKKSSNETNKDIEEMQQPESEVTFYCNEYKDLTVDIKSAKVDVLNGKRIYDNGLSVRFQHGELKTDDQRVIDHMRAHPWYGLKISETRQVETETEVREEDFNEPDFGEYSADDL